MERRLQVLVIRNAFAYDFGGAERLAVHLAEEIICNGLSATVISGHEQITSYARHQQIKTVRGWWWRKQNWSGKRALLFPIYLIWQFILFLWYCQVIVREDADVLHIMSKDDFIAGTVAGKLFGKRVLWTDCADLKHLFSNHRIRYKNPVGKLVYLVSHLADRVTLVSRSEQLLIKAALGHDVPTNFTVVHLAGRDEQVTPMHRPDADPNTVIFCTTSRLVIAKGIAELIEAFTPLAKSHPNYRLWIIGDGPDQSQFKAQAANNRQIIFWGHQKNPLTYVAACDVFVHPTHHEAFSLSLTEAAMLGKPMIASNVGGNPELVTEQNGMLFPVKDTAALRATMERLGSDKSLRQRLGRQARKDYTEQFDFRVIVREKIIPLYGLA